MGVANIVSLSRDESLDFHRENVIDVLYEASFSEEQAECMARVLSHCFISERFKEAFARTRLKVILVRSGLSALEADTFLDAIEPSVRSGKDGEIRAPVQHAPAAGKVVMCDFSYLRRPEMQKERRAVILSKKSANPGRCVLVPVSKSPTNNGNPHNFRFEAGAYPFFHQSDPVWAVCDHIYTVALDRLWQVNVLRRPVLPSISETDLQGIKQILGTVLGL